MEPHTRTEVIIGYGSLLSKKGITREGTAPQIHAAWAVRIPGRRGFAKTFRNGRKPVMDLFLDEAKVLAARPLAGLVPEAAEGPKTSSPDVDEAALTTFSDFEEQPSFEAVALEVSADDWGWFDAREEFPEGLGAALARESARTGRPVAALLSTVMAEAGLEGYVDALFDHYRDELVDPDRDAFLRCYLPWPVRLPDRDVTGTRMPHAWAVICQSGIKERGPESASEAAQHPETAHDELIAYYHDLVLGAVHGIDVADVQDAGFEAAHPELERLLEMHRPFESRPLTAFLGNRRIASPRSDEGHGMRPLKDLVSYDEAVRRLSEVPFHDVGTKQVPLDAADGRVVAADVHAAADVPGFDKSAMDGYAIRAEDSFGASEHAPRRVRCIGIRHAGVPDDVHVETGTALQIATGAALPSGADAVIMVEGTTRQGDEVLLHHPVAVGQNVVPRASDLRAGERIVEVGRRLDPVRIAALASAGVSDLTVKRRPRVAVLGTGDEVVPPGQPLSPGQVHDANTHTLAAWLRRHGVEVTRIPGVPDEPEALLAALHRAAEEHDLVIASGGTSAGARDLLPKILADHGEVLFHGIKVRPGKPVVAARFQDRLVVGLPGYTTSCLLVAETLLHPLVSRLAGAHPEEPAWRSVRAAVPMRGKEGWRVWVPVRITEQGAEPCFRGSAVVSSLLAADGFVEFEEGSSEVAAGAEVRVRSFH